MNNTNLKNADLRDVNFKETCFWDADISGANLYGVMFGIYPDDQIH